jgi:hypothetical protein
MKKQFNVTNTGNLRKWFWKMVGEFNNSERQALLKFMSGSSRLLKNTSYKIAKMYQSWRYGYSEDGSGSENEKETKKKHGRDEYLPHGTTCSNEMGVPVYSTYE